MYYMHIICMYIQVHRHQCQYQYQHQYHYTQMCIYIYIHMHVIIQYIYIYITVYHTATVVDYIMLHHDEPLKLRLCTIPAPRLDARLRQSRVGSGAAAPQPKQAKQPLLRLWL